MQFKEKIRAISVKQSYLQFIPGKKKKKKPEPEDRIPWYLPVKRG